MCLKNAGLAVGPWALGALPKKELMDFSQNAGIQEANPAQAARSTWWKGEVTASSPAPCSLAMPLSL